MLTTKTNYRSSNIFWLFLCLLMLAVLPGLSSGATFSIAASEDDACATDDSTLGSFYTEASVINGRPNLVSYDAFFRWNTNIPKGSMITYSRMSIKAWDNSSGNNSILIYGINSANCPSFVAYPYNLPNTPVSASFTAPDLTTGRWYGSPDITSIVSTLINAPGYVQGNYIGVRVTSSNNGNNKFRTYTAWDAEASSENATKLVIGFNPPPTAVTLLSPSDSSIIPDVQPTFTWSTAWDADDEPIEYQLQVSTTANFSSFAYVGSFSANTNDMPSSPLTPLIPLYWRVISRDSSSLQNISSVFSFTINPPPAADFSATPVAGFGPMDVTFTDNSLYIPTAWEWSFGDGSTSNDQNPVHTYAEVTEPTAYTVQLVVTNAFGSDTMVKSDYIQMGPQLSAGFYADETIGVSPFIAYFTDTSVNNPTEWAWDFGDGNTSSDQNPSHTYNSVSENTSFTVSLVVSNIYGKSTAIYENYIQVLSYSLQSAQLPSLKLFIDTDTKKSVKQWLPDAFPLERYVLVGESASYDQVIDFLGLSSISGTTVNQDGYTMATTGMNVYRGIAGSTMADASNLVKYSTYKIRKLPRLGMNVGDIVDINMGDYTYNESGKAVAESFGNPLAIENPDSSKITAEWLDNSTLRVTALSELTSGPTLVNVIASPVSPSEPTKQRAANLLFGPDQDKEYIWVYPNKLSLGYFTSADDTAKLFLKKLEDRDGLADVSYVESYTDAAGLTENNVLQFSLSSAVYSSVNGTPEFSSHVAGDNGKWYVARMRVCADTPENDIESDIVGYRGIAWDNSHIDISGNIFFGTPTVWTWQEAYLYTHDTGDVYPQFRFKTWNSTGNVYLKELQILQAAPQLLSLPRSDIRDHFAYANPTSMEMLAEGWSTYEFWYGSTELPDFSIVDNEIQLGFSGDTTVLKGTKMTAKTLTGLYTPGNVANRLVGIRLDARLISGSFDQKDNLFYQAVYGVQEAGQYNFRNPPGQLIATGEIGSLTDGPHYAIAEGRNPYHQVQFASRGYNDAVIGIKDIDFIRDADDPNFGDWTLFPWQETIPVK